ncbi:hypothetical protein SAMN04488134_11116 [Amphibacillus marinus]|uniref:Tetratricopeptide repeat-containing protein n=1 Tax=Amphibacillus marinus TaxID=872970 RepID=A0A1H8RS85_9BACI|nr:hypothetical protein [Amphibacillus marinus]SEO69215.1 hypothetical protein SAMN04488134_11116 [Amphibacillus marinus]
MTNNKKDKKETRNHGVIPFVPEGDFFFSKGVEAFYKRKFDRALKWLKKAAEVDPDEALYPAQMSIIYTEIGAYHAANQILTEVIDKHGSDYYDCYYLIANNYAHLGLLNEAQKYASLYLEKDPSGEFISEAEQLLTVLDESFEEDEDWLEDDELLIYQETAFYHLQRHEWDLASTLLAEMIDRFPDYPLAQRYYFYAQFFAGNKAKAIKAEESFLEQSPGSLFALANLAVFYHEVGNTDRQDRIVKQLLNVYPMQSEQSLKIALTLAHTDYLAEAFQRFSVLPKRKVKSHLEYYRGYAKVAYLTGFKVEAEKIWAEGCKLHEILRQEPFPWKVD